MNSRKLAPNEDENPSKRQRVSNNVSTEFRASFDSLNDDCVLNICRFLPIDDINTFGTINRRCRVLRRHESLDRTRIATITCSRGANQTTAQSLYGAFAAATNVLSDQYTYLRLVGLESADFSDESPFVRGYLPHVTKLELVAALNPTERADGGRSYMSRASIPRLYPIANVTELVLNHVIPDVSAWTTLLARARRVAKITCVGDGCPVPIHGLECSSSFTDLSLDRCCLRYRVPSAADAISFLAMVRRMLSSRDNLHSVLCLCKSLQRLNLKGATWWVLNDTNGASPPEPIPQDMLIKMVRCHETLRWLRSDLTQENVAMIQQERPEITFVSD